MSAGSVLGIRQAEAGQQIKGMVLSQYLLEVRVGTSPRPSGAALRSRARKACVVLGPRQPCSEAGAVTPIRVRMVQSQGLPGCGSGGGWS